MDTATHGFKQAVEIWDPVDEAFVDVTEKVHNAGINRTRDGIDTSTFGQGDKTSMNGMRDGTFSLDYYLDKDLRILINRLWHHDDPVDVKWYPEGKVSGKDVETSKYNMVSAGDGGNISSAVGGSAQFQRSGPTTVSTVP